MIILQKARPQSGAPRFETAEKCGHAKALRIKRTRKSHFADEELLCESENAPVGDRDRTVIVYIPVLAGADMKNVDDNGL